MDYHFFIHRCLELAEQGMGRVGNGAMVGAVLVRGGRILAEAFHEGFGKDHAEWKLLREFDGSIDAEDILYVNLEPCCHYGKTPPCTGSILERGVKRVVFGMVDPDSRVSVGGIRMLRERGVEVIGPVLPELCERLNRGFVSVRTKGRPWVTLKRAQTRKGAIANPDGSSLKITSKEQDVWSHAFLRAKHDAILVGVETVVRDNPMLTVRCKFLIPYPLPPTPWRVVLDPHLRVPLDARVVSDEERGRTIIIKGSKGANGAQGNTVIEGADGPPASQRVRGAAEGTEVILQRRGVRVVEVPLDSNGRFVWGELWKVLLEPSGDFHGITSILVEGGPGTWEAFREAEVVDEEVVLVGGDG